MSPKFSLEQLSVVPPRSRAEQLADTLVAHIKQAGLKAGQQLGTLDDIRAEVGFARTTVSEAVALLRERGVLEIRPGRGGGIFVAEQTPIVKLRHTLLRVQTSASSAREAIELRDALEEAIALGAAENCSAKNAAKLRALAREMTAPNINYTEFMERNWRLHEEIAVLCANKMMSAVYVSCLGYLKRSSALYANPEKAATYIQARAAVHAELVEAIIAGDKQRIKNAALKHNQGTEQTA